MRRLAALRWRRVTRRRIAPAYRTGVQRLYPYLQRRVKHRQDLIFVTRLVAAWEDDGRLQEMIGTGMLQLGHVPQRKACSGERVCRRLGWYVRPLHDGATCYAPSGPLLW